MNKIRGSTYKLILIIIMYSTFPISHSETIKPSMNIYLLTDGTVEINYLTYVNSSGATIFLELPGTGYQNLLIINQDGVPLEYDYNSSGVMIETLGSSIMDILYYTQSLTSKTENIWELELTAAIPCMIVLPEGSMIIGLNQIPLEIGTSIQNPYLIMDSGEIEVSYIQGVIDQRSLAEEAIQEAHAYLQEYKDQDIVILEAEHIFFQSEEALNQNDYETAIDLAQDAIEEADNTWELASQAAETIDQATLSIQSAKLEHRTEGLEEAEAIHEEALIAYQDGEYVMAQTQALQSKIMAENTEKPKSNFLYYIGGGILFLLFGVFLVYSRRGREQEHEISPIIADLERIFEENPRLRTDEKEVIRFIAENRGELFANEIRKRFDIPRTSLWRMIRRLKEQDILEERKVGGQSLVSIHGRYRK